MLQAYLFLRFWYFGLGVLYLKPCSQNITIVNRKFYVVKVCLENGYNSKQMITEGEAAIPLETIWCAFVIKRNQNKDQL